MSLPDYSPETNNILALLNVPVSTSQLPSADPEPSLDTASSRPMNFSSAFSQNSRPKRNAAIAASQNLALQAQTAQHYNDNNTFDDFSFLSNGGAEAGPGPNSIAAAVARNGIQGDYNVNDPYRLPEPPGANDEMYAALLRSGASNLDELVEQEGEGGGGGKRKKGKKGEEGEVEVEPVKRGRGRPRKDGKPVGTPRTPPPPKKRGRPPRKETTQPRNTTTKGKRKMTEEGDAFELPTPPAQYQALSGGGGGRESYFPDLGAVPQLSPSNQDSDSESSSNASGSQSGGGSDREGKEEKKKRKKKRNKKGDPPLIPRIFRQAQLIREDESLLDLEVHESEEKNIEEVEELTEEQKDEIRRAMNPLSFLSFSLSLSFSFADSPRMVDSAFATKLLEALEEHSEYYDRAYRALHEELLATQIEESLLQHVKEVVLVSFDVSSTSTDLLT